MLVVRRLRCTQCRKIHHELPDCVVPYKRYESACVEQVVSGPEAIYGGGRRRYLAALEELVSLTVHVLTRLPEIHRQYVGLVYF